MFIYKIDPITTNGVVTIGEKYLTPKSIGIVSWLWNKDEVQINTKKLNNLIYFPDSPVNIISVTSLI